MRRPNENAGYRNKIDRKHVDFLLCDAATMRPLCGIELDDKSHSRADRVARDEFVDTVFETAGLPLVRVPAAAAYSPVQLRELIAPHLGHHLAQPAPTASGPHPPLCPKCGDPMVLRKAGKGRNMGQEFWGCPNYPKCQQIIPK